MRPMPMMPRRLPQMRRAQHPGGRPAVPAIVGADHLGALDQAARHGQDQRHGHVGGVFGQDARRVGDGDAARHRGLDIDIVDAGAEIGDQLATGRRPAAMTALSMRSVTVGTSTSACLHRLDQLGLAHRLVVGVEPGVEQLPHPRLDHVGQFAGDDHQGLALGHRDSAPPSILDTILTLTRQSCHGSRWPRLLHGRHRWCKLAACV